MKNNFPFNEYYFGKPEIHTLKPVGNLELVVKIARAMLMNKQALEEVKTTVTIVYPELSITMKNGLFNNKEDALYFLDHHDEIISILYFDDEQQ